MRLAASEVARITGGRLQGPDVVVDGIGLDSRALRGGELFVPIVAERDGHDFIEAALAAGAAAYLTMHPATTGGTAVVVDDSAEALSRLGAAARDRLPDRVVGITGSVGKTTTKDLASATLGTRYRTHASLRSFNNELGVPLTLANAPDDTEATVVEMGARGLGHIDQLCALARPTVGVVTTVEAVHTELFGHLEGVAEAKSELVAALPAEGTAVLNAMNPLVLPMADRTRAQVVTFGLGVGDVRAEGVEVDAELRPRFELSSPWGSTRVELGLRGVHNVINALAAAAVAFAAGVGPEGVAEGLAAAAGSPWRMELHRAPSGALVLNDAYNAGPASVSAALRSLVQLDARRRLAVLGPMAELGEHTERSHREVAELAGELGVEVLAVGTPHYGGSVFDDVEAVLAELAGRIGEGDVVLVKGSRVAGLERVAQHLLGEGPQPTA